MVLKMIFRVYFQNGASVEIEADEFIKNNNVFDNYVAFQISFKQVAWVNPALIACIVIVPEDDE